MPGSKDRYVVVAVPDDSALADAVVLGTWHSEDAADEIAAKIRDRYPFVVTMVLEVMPKRITNLFDP